MLNEKLDSSTALSCEAELALLCRILARGGYCDNIAGHITYAQPDGTMLVNPFELLWEEVKASDILRMDKEGRKLAGKWSVTVAIPLHIEAHKLRSDIVVAVHNHPRWATIWANVGRVPPVYDQTSAYIDTPTLFDEYRGAVDDAEIARETAAAMGDGGCTLLKNHGVFVIGQSIRQAHLRAVALETRCRVAWHVEVLGNGTTMVPAVAQQLSKIVDTADVHAMPHFWDTAVRREIRLDPTVLD